MLANVLSIVIAGCLDASGFSFPELSELLLPKLCLPFCVSSGVVGHFSKMYANKGTSLSQRRSTRNGKILSFWL